MAIVYVFFKIEYWGEPDEINTLKCLAKKMKSLEDRISLDCNPLLPCLMIVGLEIENIQPFIYDRRLEVSLLPSPFPDAALEAEAVSASAFLLEKNLLWKNGRELFSAIFIAK